MSKWPFNCNTAIVLKLNADFYNGFAKGELRKPDTHDWLGTEWAPSMQPDPAWFDAELKQAIESAATAVRHVLGSVRRVFGSTITRPATVSGL